MLHIILRSAPGENRKRRPAAYDKLVSLESMLRSVGEAGEPIEIIYLNDGQLDEGRLRLMQETGEIIELPELQGEGDSPRARLIRSYDAAIDIALSRSWPDTDVVYIGEDDYLFRPEAFRHLVGAIEGVPFATYFAFVGSILEHRTDAREVDGCIWHRADSTTSSFAVRLNALRTDRPLHRLGLITGSDTQICLALNGSKPYRWSRIIGDFLYNEPGRDLTLKRRLAAAARQSRMNAYALRRAFRPHQLAIPYEPLAAHWELPYRGHGMALVDWDALAEETRAWGQAEREGRAEQRPAPG